MKHTCCVEVYHEIYRQDYSCLCTGLQTGTRRARARVALYMALYKNPLFALRFQGKREVECRVMRMCSI